MGTGRTAVDDNVTPQPASDVRAVEAIDPRALAAARTRGPADEPDRTVWRVITCAQAAGAGVSDEVLQRLLPSCSLVELAAARARVRSVVVAEPGDDATLLDRLAEPSLTFEEAVQCGLLDDDDGGAKGA